MFKIKNIDIYILKLKKKWTETTYKENIPFISVGLLSGVVCCAYAFLFSVVEKLAQKIFLQNEYVYFIISPLGLIVSFLFVQKIGKGSFGSGIPQVIACIDKKDLSLTTKFLSIKTVFIKILSSLFAIFSGAAIGREGPSLQISASIGYNFGVLFEKLGIKIKSEQLIIAGAASGLAAAFNTPVGGIVYAVEELTQDHIRSYKTALLLSVLIAGFVAQLLVGNYLYLGYPQFLSKLALNTVLIVSVVSFFSGLLGSLFSKILLRVISWRKNKSFKNQLLIVFLIGVSISFSYYFFGSSAIFSGKDSINHVLFGKDPILLSDSIFRFLSPLLSSMTSVAGGIFAPSLSAGATFGGIVAQYFDPSLRTLLALAGMIGFLTGVTHTPITSFVLVLEMTDRHSAIFPMMLAAVCSSLGSRILGSKSFYEASADVIKHENTTEASN